ncbi:MAG: hypothetical protein LBF97_04125 [Elusimicrobiota bacterium]|jgi:transcriptional regulator with XRE-family HTH domain|nr:hypothetical protein [Elusimicrobiota bacterium]
MKKLANDKNAKKILKQKLTELDCTQKELAISIGINPGTFYMKSSQYSKWTQKERKKIIDFLKLTQEEQEIFFK